ncbi:MAG: hypothetical protein N2043_10985 [Ignavibacterium sp.]|nr:hypothetical protein [Ignavibacterium sp.]
MKIKLKYFVSNILKNIVYSFLTLILITNSILAQPKTSQMSSKPGAFSRMGFGARGIGLGNASSALIEGNLVAYYNPASSVFQKGNSVQTAYTFLSLDRRLNFLSFTKRFEFFSSKDTSTNRKPSSIAGFSAGILNSGVSNIDGRDNNGIKTKELSTSENLFFLGIANKFSEKLALGLTVKFYYYSLYEKMTSTSLGIDIGALYLFSDNLSFSFVISDINSKYKWDSGTIYGQRGIATEDKFPLLKKIGVYYKNIDYQFIVVGEFENSNASTNILKFGIEYGIFENLFLRGGIDQININNNDWPIKTAFGFSYSQQLNKYRIGFDYAFSIEPYSPSNKHVVGLNFNF